MDITLDKADEKITEMENPWRAHYGPIDTKYSGNKTKEVDLSKNDFSIEGGDCSFDIVAIILQVMIMICDI